MRAMQNFEEPSGINRKPIIVRIAQFFGFRPISIEEKEIRKERDTRRFLEVHHGGSHGTVKFANKAFLFFSWAIKLMLPDFLVGHPNLFENFGILWREKKFKPLRAALAAWLIFSIIMSSVGVYSFLQSSKALASSTFSMKTGYYYGSGSGLSITGIGFAPEVVIIKADTAAGSMVWKSSAMPTAVTAYLGVASADNTETEITLNTDGFTLSAALEVNTINTRYVYIAYAGSDCTSGGAMCVGSYVGDGGTSKAITTGFTPDLVIAKRTSALAGTFRTSTMSDNYGGFFSATVNDSTGAYFKTLDASGGFTVGLSNNTNGGVYYYLTFKNTSNQLVVGQFTGNGTDNRNITGIGFEPDFVFIKQNASVVPAFNTTEAWGDLSLVSTSAASAVNHIQELRSDGFQVGSSTSVNTAGIVSVYFAFGGSADISPSGSFFMQRGSYTGTGIAAAIETSFSPDLVFIKGNTTEYGAWSTSLDNNQTHYFAVSAVAFAGGITTMGTTSFTVGTSAVTNAVGITYEWVAYGNATSPQTGAGAADFSIGTYSGNGLSPRSIDHLGFQPSMAVIKRTVTSAALAVWSSSNMSANVSAYFSATTNISDGTAIRSFDSTGFSVGTGAMVNNVNVAYTWFAFKEGAYFDVGSYAGNGVADREITGIGFASDYVWTKRDTAIEAVHKSSSSTITSNSSQHYLKIANDTNDIKSFTSGGYILGNSAEVNTTGGTYQYASWDSSTSSNPPNAPTNNVPSSGATNQDLNPALSGSEYSDPESNTQTDAEWQVDDDSDFASPVWSRTSNIGEISTSIISGNGTFANELSGKTALDHGATYYWRVRYSDSVWSTHSTATSFTTNVISTPSHVSPADGDTVTTLTPTLTSSAFSDSQSGHTAASAQWQISSTNAFDSPIYDSGSASYGETLAVPSATLSDRSVFYWRVRHQDSTGQWSSYSGATRFLLSNAEVTVTPLFGQTVVDQGDSVNFDAQIKLASGAVINDATVIVSVYDPNGTKILDGQSMEYIIGSNGVYRLSYAIPSANGSYVYEVTAVSGGRSAYGAANFEVRTMAADLGTTKAAVESEQSAQIAERAMQEAERASQNSERIAQEAERTAQDLSRAIIQNIQLNISSIQSSIAVVLSEIGTGNISAIKTKTDSIVWEDITGIIDNTGTVLEKTNTINWEDVVAIKTQTDTVSWADVTEIKLKTDSIVWGDISNITYDVGVLLDQVGVGNIAAIKTAVDVINWEDITGIITSSGLIKEKTDTIDWTTVSAIQTSTEIINWEDVVGIKAKTDTISWDDIQEIQTASSQIQSSVSSLQNNIDILIGAMIVTQGSVNDSAADISSFVTSLQNSTDNFYKNAVLTFTSGLLDGQSRRISAYNGSSKGISLDPSLTSSPLNGDTFTIVAQNVRVEEQVSESEAAASDERDIQSIFRANTAEQLASIEGKIDSITESLNTVDSGLDSLSVMVGNIRESQEQGYAVTLSDVTEIQAGNTYRATLTILDFESNPFDPATAPSIAIYDATRALAQSSTLMVRLSEGVYEYTSEVSSSATSGLWEAIVNLGVGGSSDIVRNDYWQVSGAPSQVLISAMDDVSIPSIGANVVITNEGSGPYEYQYEWCVVVSQDNQCGGDNDVYYGSAAKLITPGQNFTPTLTATLLYSGDYWFKVAVYYGSEVSGASRSFSAVTESEIDGGSSGGGGGDTAQNSSNTSTDTNSDSEISDARGQLDIQVQRLSKVLDLLDSVSPGLDKLLEISTSNTESLTDIQNKIADVRAVSAITRKIVEQKNGESIVETYMKFNSVEIHFLITNPDSVEQSIKFKAFLPAEFAPEDIITSDGLTIDYDANAGMYFASGDVLVSAHDSVTRKVEMRDIWMYSPETISQIRNQVDELFPVLSDTQYEAQATILSNQIRATLDEIVRKQTDSYSSPQNHIVVYRENVSQMLVATSSLEKLKDIVVQAGDSRGVVGQVGGIQTFATWGIILAIVFGFGLMSVIIFAMWRHQTLLVSEAMGFKISRGVILSGGGNKRTAIQKTKVSSLEKAEYTTSPVNNSRGRKVLTISLAVIILSLIGFAVAQSGSSWLTYSSLRYTDVPEESLLKTNTLIGANLTMKASVPIPHEIVLEPFNESSFPQLKILDTPTGWLNVRSSASVSGDIIGKVLPAEKYDYIKTEGDWCQIRLVDGSLGWVAKMYVQLQ